MYVDFEFFCCFSIRMKVISNYNYYLINNNLIKL